MPCWFEQEWQAGFRAAVRVGRTRRSVTIALDEWPSPSANSACSAQNPAYRPSGTFSHSSNNHFPKRPISKIFILGHYNAIEHLDTGILRSIIEPNSSNIGNSYPPYIHVSKVFKRALAFKCRLA